MTRTDPKPRSREVLVGITTALILGSTAVTGCAEKPAEPPKTTQVPPADTEPTPTQTPDATVGETKETEAPKKILSPKNFLQGGHSKYQTPKLLTL